ncbi:MULTISPECIES: hypothetical protein [Corallococcus]|uniref:hypothetical protein n=1 Tax=Corallococcus TaxID=83461 RepID=UPI00117D6FFE|nr:MULTISPECIES: hypothetical protein [Corallococcus]NBD08110.1 hypothetical protein [Corallococcus silvisoli]TSC34084.1 hypothetical protein FOF48_03335 [Corallococcus sp. Z5C101001]
MKLPLMATLTALLLGGCAHEGTSRASEDVSGTGGSGKQPREHPVGASDELSWDAEASPATQSMLKDHGMDFYGVTAPGGDSGASGSSKQVATGEFECVDSELVGFGGSGDVASSYGSVTATPLIPLVSPGNPGARLDISPDAWKKNKSIGTSPVSPSTGTPAVEGSGGAGR